jgi:thymidylate synthase (methanogen type)
MGSSATGAMTFEPLHYADKLEIVNPAGDTGLVTLWTPLRAAKRLLTQLHPGILDPANSRIAALSNLYGDGMHQMMCNLLYNPQIRYLVAIGEDLEDRGVTTIKELEAFFQHGLEESRMLGTKVLRIPGTNRIFPILEGFDVGRLQRQVSFTHLGELSGSGSAARLAGFLASIPAQSLPVATDRICVTIPPPLPDDYEYWPSDVGGHQIVRRRPLDCWQELVTRTVRFGHLVELRSGSRLELLNAKVTITDPVEEAADLLSDYGFSLREFHSYQEKMLDAALPRSISYTYGNRLRSYFKRRGQSIDTLDSVVRILCRNPESRHAYISLWDTANDLPDQDQLTESAVPCLVTIFFRRSAGSLTLTATYRSHNLLRAWLENVYGLMALQQEVCKRVGMPPGPITVISHSLGINPEDPRYQFARDLAGNWKRDEDLDRETGVHTLREDPNGYFIVTIDEEEDEIVAEHRYGGLLVKQYRANRAAKIERQVIGDMAVSLPSHALWLGRELSVNEAVLHQRLDHRRLQAKPGGDL